MKTEYEELKAAIAAYEEHEGYQGKLQIHAEILLEAMKAQLAQMKPDVWVPPDQSFVIVSERTNDYVVRVSAGTTDTGGRLNCYVSGRKSGICTPWEHWKAIPNLYQFTPFEGNECPEGIKGKRVYVHNRYNGNIYTHHADVMLWKSVDAYCIAAEGEDSE